MLAFRDVQVVLLIANAAVVIVGWLCWGYLLLFLLLFASKPLSTEGFKFVLHVHWFRQLNGLFFFLGLGCFFEDSLKRHCKLLLLQGVHVVCKPSYELPSKFVLVN